MESLIKTQNQNNKRVNDRKFRQNRPTDGNKFKETWSCYTCGETGHLSRNCYQNRRAGHRHEGKSNRNFGQNSTNFRNGSKSLHFLWTTMPSNTSPPILLQPQPHQSFHSQQTIPFQTTLSQNHQILRKSIFRKYQVFM